MKKTNEKTIPTIQKVLFNHWPIIFMVAVWFIFSSPFFLKGLVPYSSTYQVNFFAPWSHYQKFWGPIKNNAMPDVHTQIYPWKKFTIDTLTNNQIPWWNPFSFSGNPHLANFQSAVLSPFNMLYFMFPFIDAWSMVILLQPILAGLFTYIFMRSLQVSKIGSLISSVSFMFCGFITVWMPYGTLSMAIAFLPLALFAVEKYSQTQRLPFLFLLSFSILFSFFSGHFQMSFYFLLATLFYVLYKGLVLKKLYTTCYLVLFMVFGLLLSFPQIIPSVHFYLHAVRKEIFITGGGIPLYYLVNIFSPDFFGNPVTRNDWFGFYAEWASFIGIVPLSLAFISICRKRNTSVLFFLFMGLAAFLLAVDSPIQTLIGLLKIPVLSTSNPTRIIVLLSFSFIVLAGFGFDRIREMIEKKDNKKLLIPFMIIGILLLFIWGMLLIGKNMPVDKLIIAKRNLVLPTMLYGGSMILIFLSRFRKEFVVLCTFYLLLATSFDSIRFSQKWMPFDPRELVFPSVPVIDAIKKHIGNGRIFGNIGNEIGSYYQIPLIEGYDPLYIARYGEFIRAATTGTYIQAERSVVKLDRRGKYTNRVLDILGVNLIFHPIVDTNQEWAYPVWTNTERFSLIYKDDTFQLFRNKNVLSRVPLFYNIEVVKDDKEIIKRFYKDDFDYKKIVIIEEPLDFVLKVGKGNAKIVSYTPNQITIEATTSTPALLFLADNYYPGWIAKVNGVLTKIYRADYTFRAIVVPQGKSTVEFSYKGLSL